VVIRRAVPLFLGAMMAVVLTGCGKGAAFNTGATMENPVASAALSIAFQSTPAASVPLGFTTGIAAVVSNDPYDYGVDWSVTCASSNCGSVTPLHTTSGQATTYTPPSTFVGNQLPVNIVAFATADHTKNIPASITVTAFLGILHGTYVFQAQGSNYDSENTHSAHGPYQTAGVVTLDGNGGVVGGEQTFSDSFRSGSTAITGGNYTVGPDGRGVLNLKTSATTLSSTSTETFSLVYLNPSKSLIAQADSNNSATGTMELQTGTAAPAGGYAFAVSGIGSAGVPAAFGGVFNVDQPKSGSISGIGSVADLGYFGTVNGKTTVSVQNCSGLSGTVLPLPADAFGTLQLTLIDCFAASPPQFTFTGYVVDATHIKLIETDAGFATSGIAIGQGPATGIFSGARSFSGTDVFGISGMDSSKYAGSLASAGRLVADGAGNLSGLIDEFGGSGSPAFSGAFNSGTYAVDSSGTGRVTASTNLAGASGSELLFYLTGDSNIPALVLDFDPGAPAAGSGLVYAQASPAPSLQPSGDYGLNAFTNAKSAMANDVTGQMSMTLDTTTNLWAVTGVLDDYRAFGSSIAGNFQATLQGSDYSGTLDPGTGSKLPSAIPLDLYLIDDSHGFLIETDSATSGSTFLGYVAARTPVCPVCP